MRRLLAAVAVSTLWACGDQSDLVLTLDDVRGAVSGVAFVDENGDGLFSTGEDPAPGVLAAIVVEGTRDTVARATSGPTGAFIMPDVPVGRYELLASRGSLIGDTLDVVPFDSTRILLTVGDTVVRNVRLAFQTIRVAQLGQLPSGRRVAIEGIALNGWSTFGDSTVHLTDASGSVRALRTTASSFAAGDSVRIVGSIGTDQGRVALVDATVRVLAPGRGLPPVPDVTTAAASAAQGGLAYGQARITDALISDTATVGRDRRLTVNDGSGVLQVLLDGDVSLNLTNFVPGAAVEVMGVLVPTSAGPWQLKPRTAADAAASFPTITIAEARQSEVGRRVVLEGVALNSVTAFGDSTVHLRDSSGYIRAVRVPGVVAGGDSVRLLGTIAVRAGQPVLSATGSAILRAGVGVGEPDSVSTRVANTADNGALDAAQVRIGGTILGTQLLTNGDFLLTVDDGSGRTEVLFDQNVPVITGPFVPGAVISARGVLVPTGAGTWRLLPRGGSDVSATFTTVTIAELRALPAGKRVYVHGIALNSWSTFGDSTIHVADATAAVRVLRATSPLVFAGDSVRVLGTVAMSAGQTVLTSPQIDVVLTGAGLPAADSLATLAAANAVNGTRDAAQVRARGRISSVQTATNGDTHLAIDDGSGALSVRLDRDAGFTPGAFQEGQLLSVRGVLVPEGFPTFWQLKPRSSQDLVVVPGGAPAIDAFRTTWREYLTGMLPGGWTRRWDSSSAFQVVEDPTTGEGKALQWSGANLPRNRWALSYDGFGDLADQDVYTEFRVRSLAGALPQYLMGAAAVRIGGTAALEQGYWLAFQDSAGVREVALLTFNNGALVELDAAPFSWAEDAWYGVRLEAVGTSIRGRVWVRGETEPTEWSLSATDARWATGRPGVATSDVGVVQWEVWEGRRR